MRRIAASYLLRESCSVSRRRSMINDIEEAHRLAIHLNQNSYEDPATKYQVFTSKWLESRGNCCGFNCRHCPYGHFAVQSPNVRNNIVQKSILINASKKKNELNNCEFMVYNGDKEGIAMLVNYEQERKHTTRNETEEEAQLILIALVEETTGVLIASKVHCYDIFDQCKQLNFPLYVLPCAETSDIRAILENGLIELIKSNRNVYLPMGFPAMASPSTAHFTYVYPSQHLDDAKYEEIHEIIKKETRGVDRMIVGNPFDV